MYYLLNFSNIFIMTVLQLLFLDNKLLYQIYFILIYYHTLACTLSHECECASLCEESASHVCFIVYHSFRFLLLITIYHHTSISLFYSPFFLFLMYFFGLSFVFRFSFAFECSLSFSLISLLFLFFHSLIPSLSHTIE